MIIMRARLELTQSRVEQLYGYDAFRDQSRLALFRKDPLFWLKANHKCPSQSPRTGQFSSRLRGVNNLP